MSSHTFIQNKDLLLQGMQTFLADPSCRRDIRDILCSSTSRRRQGVSMRYLEWVATTHAREKPVLLSASLHGGIPTDVHTSYKQQLARWTKAHFDPFARHEKLELKIGNTAIKTSAGQLNFLRWAIETGVLAYARKKQFSLRSEITRRAAVSRAKKARQRLLKARVQRSQKEEALLEARLLVDPEGFRLGGRPV